MNEKDAIKVAQTLADLHKKEFVILKCNKGLCNILSYENFKLSQKTNYYLKIVPTT